MNIKVHYIVTICALFFLGVMIVNPAKTIDSREVGKTCELNQSHMDCFDRSTDYRINKNSEVQYN